MTTRGATTMRACISTGVTTNPTVASRPRAQDAAETRRAGLGRMAVCKNGVFVDVGANNGDSLIKWYELEGCFDLKQHYEEMKQAWPGVKKSGCAWEWPVWLPLRTRRQYCAKAFEPNPQLAAALIKTAHNLSLKHGVAIEVFEKTALSNTDDSAVPFFMSQSHSRQSSVSSSLLESKVAAMHMQGRPVKQIMVKALNAVDYLNSLAGSGPVAVKLDVEGLERELMRELVRSGVLCKRVDALWVEWHQASQMGQRSFSDSMGGAPRGIDESFRWILRQQNAMSLRNLSNPPWHVARYQTRHCRTSIFKWT